MLGVTIEITFDKFVQSPINLSIPETSLQGYYSKFSFGSPCLLRILEASFGELNPREIKNVFGKIFEIPVLSYNIFNKLENYVCINYRAQV